MIRTISFGDWTKIAALGLSVGGLIYLAGVQSTRLNTIEEDQHRTLNKLEELDKHDTELKIEMEKIRARLDAQHIGAGYSLLRGDE